MENPLLLGGILQHVSSSDVVSLSIAWGGESNFKDVVTCLLKFRRDEMFVDRAMKLMKMYELTAGVDCEVIVMDMFYDHLVENRWFVHEDRYIDFTKAVVSKLEEQSAIEAVLSVALSQKQGEKEKEKEKCTTVRYNVPNLQSALRSKVTCGDEPGWYASEEQACASLQRSCADGSTKRGQVADDRCTVDLCAGEAMVSQSRCGDWTTWSPCECEEDQMVRRRVVENCESLEQSEVCEPQECECVGEYADAVGDTSCDGSGDGVSRREFVVREGTRDCPATIVSTCAPVDCVGTWEPTEDLCRTERVLQKARYGGEECATEAVCDPINCEGTWEPWDESRCREGGGRTRRFLRRREHAHGGTECPEDLVDTCAPVCTWSPEQDCADVPDGAVVERTDGCGQSTRSTCPPVDCEGTWSPEVDCREVPDNAVLTRDFHVTVPRRHGGRECETPVRYTCAPIDCEPIGWEDTGECDADCGVGKRLQTFRTRPARHGGFDCWGNSEGDTREVECDSGTCDPEECRGEWGTYEPCDGLRPVRERRFRVTNGGEKCAQTSTLNDCDVDCAYTWERWDSSACGDPSGQRVQRVNVTREHANGGEVCPTDRTDTCAPRDCQGTWSPAECGERSTFRVSSPAMHGGRACEATDGETRDGACEPVNCRGIGWEYTSDCDAACQEFGKRQQTYRAIPAEHGGLPCWPHRDGDTREVDCQNTCVPVDCEGTWEPQGCDATCGPGAETWVYRETRARNEYGTCDTEDGATRESACETRACPPVDCVGTWSAWDESQCATDGGTRRQTFSVLEEPRHGGGCPDPERIDTCPPVPCEGAWSEWDVSACTQDGGAMRRSFRVSVEPRNGGSACPTPREESRPCEPVNCEGRWPEEWDTSRCGRADGMREKVFEVDVKPINGGTECPAVQTLESTCAPVPCEVTWGSWDDSGCAAEDGVREQGYTVDTAPLHGGETCPPARTGTCAPVPCEGRWSEWDYTSCSDVGQCRSKVYTVDVPSKHGGAECEAADGEYLEETMEPMCVLSEWKKSGGCRPNSELAGREFKRYMGTPCGPGTQMYYRDILANADVCYSENHDQGLPLERVDACEVPCTRHQVGNMEDARRHCRNYRNDAYCNEGRPVASTQCVYAPFGEWSECDCDNYPYTKRRARTLLTQNGSCRTGDHEVQECALTECPIKCELSEWSPGTCHSNYQQSSWDVLRRALDCGPGTRLDTREVLANEEACAGEPLERVQACEAKACTWHDIHNRLKGFDDLCDRWGGKYCDRGGPKYADECLYRPNADSEWSECDQWCGPGTQTRTTYLYRTNEGETCPSERVETQACTLTECPLDCEVTWGPWDDTQCDAVDGVETQRYTVVQNPTPGGEACPTSTERIQTCEPVDCVANWSAWTDCSNTCGEGERQRTYTVEEEGMHGGVSCEFDDQFVQYGACEGTACPVDCAVSTWEPWGECSETACDRPGQRTRVRDVLVGDKHGGQTCPPLAETEPCNTDNTCPPACEIGPWTDATSCVPNVAQSSSTYWRKSNCGTGTKLQRRSILKFPEMCYQENPDSLLLERVVNCNVGCNYIQNSFRSSAQQQCDNSQNDRSRAKRFGYYDSDPQRYDNNVNEDCDKDRPRYTTPECTYAEHGTWSPCSASCGPGGTQSRERTLLSGACATGDAARITQECFVTECPVPCEGAWTAWDDSQCPSADGMQSREYQISVQPKHGGQACPAVTYEERTCAPVPCEGAWTAWDDSQCPSADGVQSREYQISVQPRHGGQACPAVTYEERTCAPVPCQGEWTGWDDSQCPSDDGVQSREYQISVQPRHGGQACPAVIYEERTCAPVPCEGAYVLSDTCADPENGVLGYTYEVSQPAVHGGQECPAEYYENTCAPVPCEGAWTEWDDSSCEFVNGVQSREYQIAVQPVHGGQRCPSPLYETRTCAPVPCEGSYLEDDSGCGTDGGMKTYTYDIEQRPMHGGQECPVAYYENTCAPFDCVAEWVVSRPCDPCSDEDQIREYPPPEIAAATWVGQGNRYTTAVTDAAYGNGTYVLDSSAHAEASGDLYSAKHLFNKLGETNKDCLALKINEPGAFIYVALPSPIALQSYMLRSRKYAVGSQGPRTWKLYGSSDAVNWVLIDDHATPEGSFGSNEARTYELNESDAYRHYKLDSLTSDKGGHFCLSELRLFGTPVTRDREMRYNILEGAMHGGTCEFSQDETRVEACEPCPIDCTMGEFGEWGACSTNCGSGVETRTRPTIPAQHGGDDSCPDNGELRACDQMELADRCTDVADCNYTICDFSVKFSDGRPCCGSHWTPLSSHGSDSQAAFRACSANRENCGYVANNSGTWQTFRKGNPGKYRGPNRKTYQLRDNCKARCDEDCFQEHNEEIRKSNEQTITLGQCNTETRPCSDDSGCVVDCKGKWVYSGDGKCYINWEGSNHINCDTPINKARKRRVYRVTTPAKNGGRACEARDGQVKLDSCNADEFNARKAELNCSPSSECCFYQAYDGEGKSLVRKTLKGTYRAGSGNRRISIDGKGSWSKFKDAKAACDSTSKCKSIFRLNRKWYALNRDIKTAMVGADAESDWRKYDYNYNKRQCGSDYCDRYGNPGSGGSQPTPGE